MEFIIKVSQKEAVLLGKNIYGPQIVDIDVSTLSQEEREELSLSKEEKIDKYNKYFMVLNGNIRVEYSGYTETVTGPDVGEATVDAARNIIDYRIKKRKEAHKKLVDYVENKRSENLKYNISMIKEWMGRDLLQNARNVVFGNTYYPYLSGDCKADQILPMVDGATEYKEDLDALIFWVKLEESLDRIEIKKKKQKTVEELALIAHNKEKTLKQWVRDHGDDLLKERYAAGYVLKNEIIHLIKNSLYKGLNGYRVYEEIDGSDCVENNHDTAFDVDKAIDLNNEEFMALKEIIKNAPKDSVVTPREHTFTCEDCDTKISKIGFKVDVKYHDFDFSSEYQL